MQRPIERRAFLRGSLAAGASFAAGMNALDQLARPALADELRRGDKRVILLWLAGGASQLETWDPKPGRETGGPFGAIPTSVPGIHISQLMPKIAARMQHTAIVRSLNTKNGDHGGGARLMHLGRFNEPGVNYPDLGAMVARELSRPDRQAPDYVTFYTATEGRGNAIGQSGFLGARFAPMSLTTESEPENLDLPSGLDETGHKARAELRNLFSRNFAEARRTDAVASHQEAFGRIDGLMASQHLFDIEQEPAAIRDAYGPTLFGRQTLIARRLIDAGTPFVKISRAWWDSHGQNFETHLELVSELDQVLSALLDDLHDRGLLEHTLVLTLSEFGRTPEINPSLGRDHFASAWSVSLSGCGIRGGSVFGKTDDDGRQVVDGEVSAPQLFATIFQALGIDHQKNHYLGPRPIPLTEPGAQPIREVLA